MLRMLNPPMIDCDMEPSPNGGPSNKVSIEDKHIDAARDLIHSSATEITRNLMRWVPTLDCSAPNPSGARESNPDSIQTSLDTSGPMNKVLRAWLLYY